jgi:hypothetical protein
MESHVVLGRRIVGVAGERNMVRVTRTPGISGLNF